MGRGVRVAAGVQKEYKIPGVGEKNRSRENFSFVSDKDTATPSSRTPAVGIYRFHNCGRL